MIELRIPTQEEIDLVSLDSEIWDRTADDNCLSKDEFKLPYENFEFRGFYIGGKIIGLASIEKDGNSHFYILKPYRKKYAREIFRLCLEQLRRPVYCAIPEIYSSVINFVKKGGFKENGFYEREFLKNGNSYRMIKLIYNKND